MLVGPVSDLQVSLPAPAPAPAGKNQLHAKIQDALCRHHRVSNHNLRLARFFSCG